jgi:predicted Rossmann-fold nucleotide-binding protein
MKRICVYCGSNMGRNPRFKEAAIELGNERVGRSRTGAGLWWRERWYHGNHR